MTLNEVRGLSGGDEIFWEDPDDGLCSRHLTIGSIKTIGSVIAIQDIDGNTLECFAHELK